MEAAEALGGVLSRFVLPRANDLAPLADAVATAVGAPGWCCQSDDDTLTIRVLSARDAVATVDGAPWSGSRRPSSGETLVVQSAGRALLGSPIDLPFARRAQGVVGPTPDQTGLEGTAWCRGDPDRAASLTIASLADPSRAIRVRAEGRAFRLTAADLAPLGPGMLRVTDADGRELSGSPLDPDLLAGHARSAAQDAAASHGWAKPAQAGSATVAIIVPVHRDAVLTRECLSAVSATVPPGTAIIVVDDATPEPDLAAWLDGEADAGRIVLLRNAATAGFPRSVNRGLRAAPAGADLVLLNSDTRPAGDWVTLLLAALHAAPDIGTATPLSNDATILSYPRRDGGNAVPDLAEAERLARLAALANAGTLVDLPTGVGFCLAMRRDCIEATGFLRAEWFAQGYGEENDLCARATALGWRHVGVPAAYVAHVGARSFGAARPALLGRNLALLEILHPGHGARIAAWIGRDPLAPARRRLDAARWRDAAAPGAQGAVLFVTHGSGGGVEQVIQSRVRRLDGRRRAILIRPVADADADPADPRAPAYRAGYCRVDDGTGGYPNLVFRVPDELDALAELLRPDAPSHMEVHHLLGHDHAVLELAGRLALPVDVHVHDYAAICPRVTLTGPERRYCGEPADVRVCEACVADAGRITEEAISVAALRARSAADLAAARAVVVPSDDAARRLRRHLPSITPMVARHEDDTLLPRLSPPPVPGARRRVAVVGAIGPEKGYDVLLACARDAAWRDLPLDFALVGYTPDDARLLDTGRVFVTGPYRDDEATALIAEQNAQLGLLPSVWPETWCFALTHLWRAGLAVAAFDIGAQAERIRASGRGWLMPLGLPAPALNNALLAACLAPRDECRPSIAISA